MADYREMYFKLFSAVQQAIELLIQAQQDCESAYMSEEDKLLVVADNPQKSINNSLKRQSKE